MKNVLVAGLLGWAVVAVAELPNTGYVNFNKDVLPILQRHCQVCHRPGEIGPMSFMSYESTYHWAEAIKAVVTSGKMPPWFADPRYGHFLNEKHLTGAEIEILSAWAELGAPEGKAYDPPLPASFREGWNIRPDLVFKMSEPFDVPATGKVEYVHVTISAPFKEDTWVVAGEIRPGNRSVVHHAALHIRPKDSKWMKESHLGRKPFIPGSSYIEDLIKANGGNPAVLDNQFIIGLVPGMEAQRFDLDHSAMLIPAGADLVLQMHYTPSGRAAEDQSVVGLELAKEPPKRRFLVFATDQMNLDIAPGDPNAEATARLVFGKPVSLAYMQPHMHLRGKDARVDSVYPGGARETLLSIPRYDFDWQIVYYLKNPLRFPAGTALELVGHYDNSSGNKNNPDPTQRVRWGEQSDSEMLTMPVGVIIDRDIDPAEVVVESGVPGGVGVGVHE